MATADASITIGADDSQLRATLDSAANAVKAAMTTMKGHIDGLSGILDKATGAFAAFAAVAAGAGVFDKSISAATKYTGEVVSLAKALGITTEEASGLNVALGDIGSDADSYNEALQKLTKQVRTNEDALNQMSIKTRDANGEYLNGRALMDSAIAGLKQYKEGTDRNLAAQVAFGKGAAEATKLLKLNADIQEEAKVKAQSLGLVIGVDNVAAVKAYKLAMNESGDVLLAIETVIGTAVMPVLTKLANWFAEGGPAAVSVFKAVAQGIGDVLTIVADTFMELWDSAKEALSPLVELFQTESNATLSFGDIVHNVFTLIEVALLTFKTGFVLAFDGVRGAIDVLIANLRAFGSVAAAVLHGDFSGAASAWKAGMNDIAEAVANAGKRMYADAMVNGQKIADVLGGGKVSTSPTVAAAAVKPTGTKLFNDPTKKTRLEDTSKAEYAVAKAQFEAALNLQKEYLKEAQEGYDEAYKHNLISIEEYYADRIATEQKSIQLEIDAKNQEIAAVQKAESTATTDRERLTLKAQEIKLTGELTVLTAQYAQVSVTETRKMTDAERERADGLKNLQIQSQINIGNSQVAMDRIALDTRKQLRQESEAQTIQDEKGFEDRITQIQRDAIQQRIDMEKAGTNDPVKIASLNAQLEDLERTHQEKLTQLDANATVERQKYATEFAQQAQDSFATFFNDLTDRTKKLSDTFKSLFQNLMKNFNDIASKKLAEQVLGAGSAGGGFLNQISTSLFGGSAVTAKAGAGTGDASAQALTALTGATTQATAGMEGLSTSGIGGMFKSATDWIAKNIAGTVSQEAQTTTGNTLTTALAALTEAAYGAATALQGVGAGGSSSGSGNIFGSLLGSAGDDAGGDAMGAFIEGLPAFADGTNYVPADMLAMIHKGEKITPARYNNDDSRSVTIHQTNNFPADNSRASASQAAASVATATSQAMRRNS